MKGKSVKHERRLLIKKKKKQERQVKDKQINRQYEYNHNTEQRRIQIQQYNFQSD